jgi:hypothetical protein
LADKTGRQKLVGEKLTRAARRAKDYHPATGGDLLERLYGYPGKFAVGAGAIASYGFITVAAAVIGYFSDEGATRTNGLAIQISGIITIGRVKPLARMQEVYMTLLGTGVDYSPHTNTNPRLELRGS